MGRDRRRMPLVVAWAAGAALMAAACGGSDEGRASREVRLEPVNGQGQSEQGQPSGNEPRVQQITAEVIRSVADTTAEAGTYAMEMEVGMNGPSGTGAPPGLDGLSITASGQFDTAARRGEMQLDMGELAGLLGRGSSGDGVVRVVIDGDTTYLNYGELGEAMGLGSQWVSLDAGELMAGAGDLWGQPNPTTSDPSAFMEVLRGAASDIDIVGQEDVRGVPTTHVRATVDLEQALAEAPAEQRALIEGNFEQLGLEEIPMEVWVDGEGLPRRISMALDPADAPELGGIGFTLTMDIFDYGEPVDIEIPEPADVVDGSGLLGGVPGGSEPDLPPGTPS